MNAFPLVLLIAIPVLTWVPSVARAQTAQELKAPGQGGANVPTEQTTVAGPPPSRIIPLSEWDNRQLYGSGWLATGLLGQTAIGPDAGRIGHVKDIVIGPDGQIMSVIVAPHGIPPGDVNVPWPAVKVGWGRVELPLTEQNIEKFARSGKEDLGPGLLETEIFGIDREEPFSAGPGESRPWKANELIGDFAMSRGGVRLGYVRDILFTREGSLLAVMISPPAGVGHRLYAVPFYGYPYGWHPDHAHYDLPYSAEELAQLKPFDADRLSGQ